LVLENYHVIRDPVVHEAVQFLIDRCPRSLHVVITTREDPPFRLSDLRTRGLLIELRTAHLRFTPAEGAEFLRTATGLTVSAEEAAALHARTDGWAAALQLAGVSMHAGAEVSGFIAGLEGSRQTVGICTR